ncbi:MAG TPA: DNA polymerase I [Bacteroidales bacterium]|jgi:DNA polymerase-1|nr:DNA polymerase I [Bacteroidales bacterium]
MMMKKIFLLDAMALIYRGYYALIKSPRITSKGVNTTAVFGFMNTLFDLLQNEELTHIAVSFDTGAPTLRHAEFEDYKANREATPDDIVNGIPIIMEILKAMNIPIILKDGYEADDIIGTMAKRAEMEDFEVYMMTSDKDYGQLVSEHIHIYKPGKLGQKAEVIGVKEVCEKYEIQRPEQLIDILGLWGDASDNIPGVPSIGEVKAKRLISEYHSIENIYQNIDQLPENSIKKALVEHQDKAILSKSLATIITDVPVEFDLDEMKKSTPDMDQLQAIFRELEFRTLLRRLDKVYPDFSQPVATQPDLFSSHVPEETDQKSLFSHFDELAHHYRNVEEWSETGIELEKSTQLMFDWIFKEDKIVGFAVAADPNDICYHLFEEEKRNYLSMLEELFEKPLFVISYQTKQTYKYLRILNIDPQVQFFDIQIAHYLIQPERSHQLSHLTESYLEYTLLNIPNSPTVNQIVSIACEKVELYQPLYQVLTKELKESQLEKLFYKMEMPLSNILGEMELQGIRLDSEILKESSEQITREIEDLENKIFEYAGVTFNLASPKQLGEVLFEKLRIIENAKLTKTKQYQTGEEVLQKLVNKHPIVQLVLDWRTLSKLKSTYLDALPDLVNPKTGKIHTTFQQTVTATGRLSSTNPNIQNIPIRTDRGKEIRKAFTASSEDYQLVSADYSQIELRVVASVAEDQNMIQAFRNGEDIHTATAAKVFHIAIDEVTAEQRRYAKTVNFGIIYGISAFGLSDRLRIPQAESRELIANYNKSFPQIEQYMTDVIEFARKHGYVETLMGRRRYIRDINSSNGLIRKNMERNAINAPIQGTAADIIKVAMIHIDQELKARNLKTKMLLQVHDELIFDVPKEELETIMSLIPQLMENAIELKVPLEVDIRSGNNWYDVH